MSAENYREQTKYDNHLIGKVALFQFVNSFLSLFYIAFYLRDQEQLKEVRGGDEKDAYSNLMLLVNSNWLVC